MQERSDVRLQVHRLVLTKADLAKILSQQNISIWYLRLYKNCLKTFWGKFLKWLFWADYFKMRNAHAVTQMQWNFSEHFRWDAEHRTSTSHPPLFATCGENCFYSLLSLFSFAICGDFLREWISFTMFHNGKWQNVSLCTIFSHSGRLISPAIKVHFQQ